MLLIKLLPVAAGVGLLQFWRKYRQTDGLDILGGNKKLFSAEEKELVRILLELGQDHLFAEWPPAGVNDDAKKKLLQQLLHLDRNYIGGLKAYIENAKRLLNESKLGLNPFVGCTPSVPEGVNLAYGKDEFLQYETVGAEAASEAAFVLVAGGLGERLGYSGIKVALPVDSASGRCFLQLYIESILALQAKSNAAKGKSAKIPLAIMTSGDTHERTLHLLESHGYFGMEPDQVKLIKQEKVACLSDNEAHIALEAGDPFAVQTKPHGHGDVHSLLHSSGLAADWLSAGVRWLCFFQDTNGLVFRALPAALGVSISKGYDVNSLAVPRKAKEAIGGIASLKQPDGRSVTINIEYNQLDPLIRSTLNPEGDVNGKNGYSPFPGNINQLVLRLEPYVAQLHENGGIIAEFVNPKYADAERSRFKSSTRLECMMQDYPKTLPSGAAVGYTSINEVWAAYSPVKNSPADAVAKAAGGNPSHSATSGELDIYRCNCASWELVSPGVVIAPPTPATFNGLSVGLYPRVSWSPSFAPTLSDLKAKVSGAGVKLGKDAVLVIEGAGVDVRRLQLEGALTIRAAPGAQVVIDGLKVSNKGWSWEPLQAGEAASEEEKMRGFRVVKHETKVLVYDAPGKYVETTPAPPPAEASTIAPFALGGKTSSLSPEISAAGNGRKV